MQEKVYSTGKRKTSIARVWLQPGAGVITVNRKLLKDYFGRETSQMVVWQPLELTNSVGQYDVVATVKGGGLTGQAGAVRHGISKALQLINPTFRAVLKRNGFLTRDSRIKERKKYGQKGARKRFQYSKR